MKKTHTVWILGALTFTLTQSGCGGDEEVDTRQFAVFVRGQLAQGAGQTQHDQLAAGGEEMAKAAGETIPEGWAVDADGKPTTDPEAALKGSLVSMGGYKGWGFGLMAELLAAGMTGSRAGVDLGPLKAPEGDPHDIGDFYLIMDPDVSGGAFFDRLTQVSGAVQRDEGARMPGQARAVQDPVNVDPDAWALAQRLAGAD